MQRVHDGDDAVDGMVLCDVVVGHQRVQDRRRIGQARRFNQHPLVGDITRFAPMLQVEQRGNQVAAHRTT
jgi:hypothetical protein